MSQLLICPRCTCVWTDVIYTRTLLAVRCHACGYWWVHQNGEAGAPLGESAALPAEKTSSTERGAPTVVTRA